MPYAPSRTRDPQRHVSLQSRTATSARASASSRPTSETTSNLFRTSENATGRAKRSVPRLSNRRLIKLSASGSSKSSRCSGRRGAHTCCYKHGPKSLTTIWSTSSAVGTHSFTLRPLNPRLLDALVLRLRRGPVWGPSCRCTREFSIDDRPLYRATPLYATFAESVVEAHP